MRTFLRTIYLKTNGLPLFGRIIRKMGNTYRARSSFTKIEQLHFRIQAIEQLIEKHIEKELK